MKGKYEGMGLKLGNDVLYTQLQFEDNQVLISQDMQFMTRKSNKSMNIIKALCEGEVVWNLCYRIGYNGIIVGCDSCKYL